MKTNKVRRLGEFRADESPLCQRMAEGHRIRKGHELTGYWESADEFSRYLVRTCCKGKD